MLKCNKSYVLTAARLCLLNGVPNKLINLPLLINWVHHGVGQSRRVFVQPSIKHPIRKLEPGLLGKITLRRSEVLVTIVRHVEIEKQKQSKHFLVLKLKLKKKKKVMVEHREAKI